MQGTTSKDGKGVIDGLDEMSPEELHRAGMQHFRAREFALARECLERYIRLVPDDADALHQLARVCYHENTGLERACECIEHAVALEPGSSSGFLKTLAEIYIHMGDYSRAQDALEEAVRKDPGDDTRLTYSLEFYMNMVKRKNGGGAKKDGPGGGGPEGYSLKKDKRHGRRVGHIFLPASILVHVIGILLVSFVSGLELPHKDDSELEFTFIDVMEEQYYSEEEQWEAGEPAAGSWAEPGPVETRGAVRSASSAGAPAGSLDMPAEGPRSLASEKAAAGLEQTASRDDARMAALGARDKTFDLSRSAPDMLRPDVNLGPRELGLEAGASEGAARAEPSAGVLSDRRSAAPAGITGGVQEAATGERSGGPSGGKAAASLDTRAAPGAAPAPKAAGEKQVAVGGPAQTGTATPLTEAPAIFSEPGAVYISSSGKPGEASAARSSEQSIKTVDRGGVTVAPSVPSGVVSADSSVRPGVPGGAGRKAGSGLGTSETGSAAPEFRAATERSARIGGAAAARPARQSSSVPAPRELGISTDFGGGETSPARAVPGRPSGLDGRRMASAAPAAPGRPGTGVAGASRGYKGAARAHKRTPLGGTAGGGRTGAGAPSGVRTSGKKAAALPGGGRKSGSALAKGESGAGPRKAGGLEDLIKDSGPAGGGQKGGKAGPGGGDGVKLGSGEKSGGGPQPGTQTAGALEGKDSLSGGKKMAEGALGVPGGTGKDKYASAAKTRAAPMAAEKLPGVSVESKGATPSGFGPVVKILTPKPGRTTKLTHVVTGMVSDTRLTKATLTVNNESRVITVSGGRFESSVALREGENVITVMAFDNDAKAGKDSVTLKYGAPSSDIPIAITEPKNGQIFDVSRSNTINVKGTVGDKSVVVARMVLNGRPKDVMVKDGRFSQEVALTQEQNTVMVEVEDDNGGVSSSNMVGFTSINITPKDIMVILTWDKPNADFDLHVYDAFGGHTYFQSPNIYEANDAISGGQLEQDAKGNFGPEVFTMEKSVKGIYTIKSNYYYSGGDGDAHATVTVVLYGDNPARRIVRVFGPHLQVDTKTGEEMWDVAKFKMPEGIFLED